MRDNEGDWGEECIIYGYSVEFFAEALSEHLNGDYVLVIQDHPEGDVAEDYVIVENKYNLINLTEIFD